MPHERQGMGRRRKERKKPPNCSHPQGNYCVPGKGSFSLRIRLLSLLLSEKAPSCYIRPGSCWDHAKQNVLQRNLHHQEQKHTPKRRPNRPLHTCTYIYTFVKMFITIRSTKMFVTIRSTSPTFTRTYKTHDNTTHMCSHRFICFVWRSARLKHLGPSASLSCPRTGPWI